MEGTVRSLGRGLEILAAVVGASEPPRVTDLARNFDIGTTYTMIAGLLNVLAIYDAWGGPVWAERRKEDEDDE